MTLALNILASIKDDFSTKVDSSNRFSAKIMDTKMFSMILAPRCLALKSIVLILVHF